MTAMVWGSAQAETRALFFFRSRHMAMASAAAVEPS